MEKYFIPNHLLFFVILIGGSIPLLSQKYDYSAFRYPDVNIKALTFSLDSYGNNFRDKSFSYQNDRTGLSYLLSGSFRNLKNNQGVQRIFNIDFRNNLYYSKYVSKFLLSTSPDRVNTITNFDIGINPNGVSRFYKMDQSFGIFGITKPHVELGYDILFNRYSDINKSTTVFSNHETKFFGAVALKIGVGRIEPMDDVFLAQFLMDDLLEAGLIKERFSETQLFELAQLMSVVRQQRVFDFRRANIFQLTEIANWMEKNNIPQNIKSFTILNDNWRSSIVSERNHGKRLSIGIIPWYRVFERNATSTSSTNFNDNYYGGLLQLQYITSKSLSQFLQTDFFVSASQAIQHFEGTNLSTNRNLTSLDFGIQYGYNPTSRTRFGLSTTVENSTNVFERFESNLNIDLSASYFLSNRARIAGNIRFIYEVSKGFDYFQRIIPLRNYFDSNFVNYSQSFYLRNVPRLIQAVEDGDSHKRELYGNVSLSYAIF